MTLDPDEYTPEQIEAWEAHKARMARFAELKKLTKATLCQMLRDGGLVWSLHPPEKWTKEEVINDIIEQEQRKAARPTD
ncbi:hypothetical protein ACFRCW_42350 [Streptomyces sp. NPDC056653]|uniref:hypothetical protein n=1 Tax=Streptomyces sp. NPDC056653 TaxID=3345894 RepID=UPI0036B3A6B6